MEDDQPNFRPLRKARAIHRPCPVAFSRLISLSARPYSPSNAGLG
jgi:hypothetical protein